MADEAALIVERENRRIASEGVVLHAAAAAVISEEGGEPFKELISSLTGA